MVRPSTAMVVSNSTIVAQLSDEIRLALRSFHKHSKTCRPCRHPVAAYQEGRDLCRTGRDLSVTITKLLYKKAEHVPHGAFEVEYKEGWTAVDGLIRIICHYNQGEFTTQVVDLKRHHQHTDDYNGHHYHYHQHHHHHHDEPQYRLESGTQPMSIPAGGPSSAQRGSQYEEDLRRRHRNRSPQRSRTNLAVYGDPHVSYLDAPTARTQADNISPSSSHRSVHFDSHVHVREFHT